MVNDLFIQLEKYGSTRERKQTENFLTELVAYLLREEPTAKEEFIRLVAESWGKDFLRGKVDVQTQHIIQSRNANLNNLKLDLVLTCGNAELIIENKVGDELQIDQLASYLEYAGEGQNRKVAVVSRNHKRTIDQCKDDGNWLKETLWWEIADGWARSKADFKCPRLIQGVLSFLRRYEMGPIEPFASEEMRSPDLWREFVGKRDGILERLNRQITDPNWPVACDLRRYGIFPDVGNREALNYRGLLWNRKDVKAATPKDTFWYFLGFRYGEPEWQPPLLEAGQPECAVFVGAWGAAEIRGFIETQSEELKNRVVSPSFQICLSKSGDIFLCRRKRLMEFINSPGQLSAILDFFTQSHLAVEGAVPLIRQRYQEEL